MPYPVASSRNRNFVQPVSFTGAYDAVPDITAAYGMRRLRSAYTGSILRIRRSSDNAEQDIGYTANGDLDTAAIATFVGGGSGYIVNWYDQSGNAYTAAQTTAASQPLYVASGQNGKPVARFDGVNDHLLTTNSFAFADGLSVVMATKNRIRKNYNGLIRIAKNLTAGQEEFELFWEIGTGGSGSVNIVAKRRTSIVFRIDVNGEPAIGTSYLCSAIWDSSVSLDQYYNGTIRPVDTTGGVLSAPNLTSQLLYIGIGYGGGTPYLDGDIAELIICNAALSTGDREAAEEAANQYFAIY